MSGFLPAADHTDPARQGQHAEKGKSGFPCHESPADARPPGAFGLHPSGSERGGEQSLRQFMADFGLIELRTSEPRNGAGQEALHPADRARGQKSPVARKFEGDF